MQRELTAILTYSSQEHNDIFQKHFHSSIERKFLDTNWFMQLLGEVEAHGQALKFVDNLQATINKLGRGRTEINYKYDCNNHYGNQDFKYFFMGEIETHRDRFGRWLDDYDMYMEEEITKEDLQRLYEIYRNQSINYQFEVKD